MNVEKHTLHLRPFNNSLLPTVVDGYNDLVLKYVSVYVTWLKIYRRALFLAPVTPSETHDVMSPFIWFEQTPEEY